MPFLACFFLQVKLYNKHNVLMEYERSTLGISLQEGNGNQYIILSKLTDDKVFRGLQSYKEDNLLHNFKILDDVLKKELKE